MTFGTIEEALEEIAQGKMIVVVDDEDRENEGDLLMAAEKVTPAAINFMAMHGRGMICVPLAEERARELDLPLMVEKNRDKMLTAFTVTVDHRESTTGISAFERARTIEALADARTGAKEFVRPGHVFPLVAKSGGVLKRAGHTEAAVDLARMAGQYPAGVICEIMNEDGTMARAPQLAEFVLRHGLTMVSVAQIIEHRRKTEKLVRRLADAKLPTRFGEFALSVYENVLNGEHHVALVKGSLKDTEEPVLVRVHSECLTGDAFCSLRCDCGEQLEAAMGRIARAGRGVLLYMRQEGRGIGLVNKIRAYQLQDDGKDTVEANERLGFPPDLRDYGIGAQILVDLGIRKIRLLTNNPKKIVSLGGHGLSIVERVPLQVKENATNRFYLLTKKQKMGHLLEGIKDAEAARS
ncbi:MAG: bifunctional 3,4-dihydroxy-2-butanone-4-phosphate synthase/GTP cyclohydrolase II [Candidatus Riflebacteria bacterium]|nr:bifunctional 3,4-dihydroxy-2-butanone-4-phosphate synthase/GTP cyclohydrolase II [Candidatus Riflebacteria bacterium]